MAESTDVRLARIETKLDILVENNNKDSVRFDKYDDRISRLEKFEAKLLGVAGVISLLISLVVKKYL